MVLLRQSPDSSEDPHKVALKPKSRSKTMADQLFYEDKMKPEAKVREYQAQQEQPEMQNQQTSGNYIHSGLAKAQAGKQFPELQPGQRVRSVDSSIAEPQHFRSFYDQLDQIVNIAKQQRMAAQARSAYRQSQSLQELLSQSPPAYRGGAQYQPQSQGRGGYIPESGGVFGQVQSVANQYGWDKGREWEALKRLVHKESSWNPSAANPTSSARGLFQKMTSLHGPVESTPAGQAGWGLSYIRRRYGSPSRALAFHNANNWY